MSANETNHGRSKAATANAATAKPCRRTNASATGRAGDVPAANKNVARRKERRKKREAASRAAAHWAKQGIPREMRGWLDF